jgi:hypothetical protein
MSQKAESKTNGVAGLPELAFEHDVKRQEEGDKIRPEDIPTDIYVPVPGCEWVEIRSTYCQDYQDALEKNARQPLKGNKPPTKKTRQEEQSERVDMIIKHLLLDWSILDRSGKGLPFSEETARVLLMEPQYRPFQEFVTLAVSLLDGRLARFTEEISGN